MSALAEARVLRYSNSLPIARLDVWWITCAITGVRGSFHSSS